MYNLTLFKLLRNANNKIYEEGYSLDDLVPILYDKYAFLIIFILVIKSLYKLCLAGLDSLEKKSLFSAGNRHLQKILINKKEVFYDNRFFLMKRFVTSL